MPRLYAQTPPQGPRLQQAPRSKTGVRSARRLRNDVRAARGNDRLTGGTGADRFSGGAGNDVNADYTPTQGDITDGS